MRVYLLILVCLLLALPASAKSDARVEDLLSDWGSVDAPLVLPAPLDWREIYGRLGEYGDIDAFSFTFEEPAEAWEIEVRVPVCGEHFTAVYPSVAVIGAGLETAEGLDLPFELAEGMGAVMLSPGERLSERPQDTEFSYFYEAPGATYFHYYYEEEALSVDIPQAGDYTLAVWEPDGHVGSYFLWVGNRHPDNMDYVDMEALEDAYALINTGVWMGQDCEAPLNAASCPPALEQALSVPENNFPERSEVGEGFVLTGTVYDAVNCLPLANAEIDFELVNADGTVDEAGTGTLFTNQQGAYQVVSNPGRSIHLYISAEGYANAIAEQLLDASEGELHFDISLAAN